MNLIRIAIERPIAVIAAVLMVVLFGLVALQVIPIQLIPDVRKPVISVRTDWPGAAPAEIEREIVTPQEDALRGLEGLEEMSSRSQDGRARVSLEFAIGQDMDKALLLVSNRLDRVSGYPSEAREPTLETAGSEDTPIAWFSLSTVEGNTRPIREYGDFVEDVVQDRLERVEGVSQVNVYGGTNRELVITVDPVELSRYKITIPQVISALRAANVSTSAGDVDEGKRRYVVRSDGEFQSPQQVAAVVLRSLEQPSTGGVARVTLGDVAVIAFAYKEIDAVIRRQGKEGLAVNAVRDQGANVIETMVGLRQAVDELNEVYLESEGLYLRQIYDETYYINSAIALVQQNIWVGGLLAAIILLLFLRSARATLIITLSIPISVIGSFVAMAAMGRSINVISLAGIAFAVGMVVDAAIVVLENIYRLRQEGKPSDTASYMGAQQVWSAVMVSALTTVLVFLPILVMDLEVGQLFRDIAVAISVSVMLSLLVAVTVIPALSNRLLQQDMTDQSKHLRLPIIDPLAHKFVTITLDSMRRVVSSRLLSLAVVTAMTVGAGGLTWLLLPKLEYLPEGNRNLILGILQPPPGYNLATTNAIANEVESAVRHLWVDPTPPSDDQAGEDQSKQAAASDEDPPLIDNFFFVARRSTTFIGASAADPSRVAELIPIIRGPVFKEPGTFGFITQPSLFGRSIGSGRSIDINVSGKELETVLGVALKAAGKIGAILPRNQGNQFRPRPGLELGAPEVRVIPDPLKLADSGVTARDLAVTVDAFNDGLRVAEITVGGKRIDLTLKGVQGNARSTQDINNLPVVTPSGKILPVSSLSTVEVTSGPTEIRRLERQRTVTLEVRPRDDLPLEAAMEMLDEQVLTPLREEGLPKGVALRMSGTADKLSETWDAMVLDLLLAVLIVYLVMAVLFESFIYPLVILFSVPLATAGGVIGLAALNLFVYQPLDMLTLLGFVILVGIVVNNAILLIHQTLYHEREENMDFLDAVLAAARNRMRPIFMSTLTSVFGMLPLVLFPGAGSELYRGLGSVVLGGLSLSAVLTLGIIPPLLALIQVWGVTTPLPAANPTAPGSAE